MLKLILVSAFVSVVVALPSIDQNIKNSLDLPIINELDKVKNDFDLNMFTEEWLDRCESMNESSTFEDIQESFHNLSQCILSKINIVKISEEIKAATPKGDLDEVFAHYCNLMPEIRSCAQPLVSSLEICLNDQGDEDLHLSIAAIDAALDFLCYKGGERMAIFLAENGTQCFIAHVQDISICLNDTLGDVMSIFEDMQHTNNSLFNPSNCELEHNTKECVVNKLKACSDPTPANIIEGLLDSMLKETPCYRSGSAFFPLPSLTNSICLLLLLLLFQQLNN